MGGEGEINTEGVCDVENTIYVAVGKNAKEGMSLLSWALKSFAGKNICLLHVLQPDHSVSLMNGRLSPSKLKWQADKTCQELQHQKIHNILNQYLLFIGQVGILSGKVWTEMNNVEEGIVKIIAQHGVRWLVMGAAAEKYYSKNSSVLKSNKAIFVCQQAPASCQIWFSCKGYLINVRFNDTGFQLASTVTLSSETNEGATTLHDHEEDTVVDTKSFHSLDSQEKKVDGGYSPSLMMGEVKEDGSLLHSTNKSQDLSCSSSVFLSEHEIQVEGTIHDKLEHAMADAENSKQRVFEESVRRWRAEEEAMEATHLAEASESLCIEEINRRKELADLLTRQVQELESIKDQHDQFLKELQIIQDQKPVLERHITENGYAEKELEEKIIQAVTLLISFKAKRDVLLVERDKAIGEACIFRKLVKEDDARLCINQFFAFSFSDIIEATQNFDPSLKIAEGGCGSVYKGIIHHVKVAIKMLPTCGSLSDLEFKHKVEVLSRVRHPKLVELIGACAESRSLIYEYLENGSLEDHLAGHSKHRPLSWQFRIRIASEICSVLIFLHAKGNFIVHGNLRPDKVLLDANFVSKISDLGIHLLVSQNDDAGKFYSKQNPEASVYLDPELAENGELTPESDVYSFGIVLLRLLTARPACDIVRDVRCAVEVGNLSTVLDHSAGDWPVTQVKKLAHLALRCCEEKRLNRPDLVAEVWPVIEATRDFCTSSSLNSTSSCLEYKGQRRIPSHFVCPIFQEVMKDPYIAADGFTYEADAIKGWLYSGHNTSPMTNLELEHCDLIPNYSLYYAIQEWQQQQY